MKSVLNYILRTQKEKQSREKDETSHCLGILEENFKNSDLQI